MGTAIGNVLPLAIGVAISPLPIMAIVLMLATPKGQANGIAFAVGWVLALAIAATIFVALGSGHATSSTGPSTWVSVVKLLIGLLFAFLGVQQWRKRPQDGETAELPKWMQSIDSFTPGKSLGLGALLSGLNPKNLALTLAAGLAIAQADISGGQEAVAIAIFVLVASLSILAPVGVYLTMGARAAEILDGVKRWMGVHNAAIMTVLFIVLGAKLIGDAIGGFSS